MLKSIAAAAFFVAGVLLVETAPDGGASLQLWGGAALGAIPVAYGVWLALRSFPPRERVQNGKKRPVRHAIRRLRDLVVRRRGIVVLLVLATLALGFALPPLLDQGRAAQVAFFGCDTPVPLRIAASSDLVEVIREAAADYERSTGLADHGCPAVETFVFAADPRAVAAEARNVSGWTDGSEMLRDVGPRPDLWITGSSAELPDGPSAVSASTTIASTPLVLAIPPTSPLIARDAPRSWPRYVNDVSNSRDSAGNAGALVRPDPRTSIEGRIATALLYGLAPSPTPVFSGAAPMNDLEVERFLRTSTDAGGFPLGNDVEMLCHHRRLSQPELQLSGTTVGLRTAVIVTEQHLARANRGKALGGLCNDALSEEVSPDRRLEAAYPTETLGLDVQVARFTWAAPTDRRQTRSAGAFADWLAGSDGRSVFTRHDYRAPDGHAADRATATTDPAPGIDPTVSYNSHSVDRQLLDDGDRRYRANQPRGRVLFLLDTSGSMGAPAPGGTRLTTTASAVRDSCASLGRQDEVGLWTFPDASGIAPLPRFLPGPMNAEECVARMGEIAAVPPAGNTPLYRSITDATSAARSTEPGFIDSVVVVTDGENTVGGGTPSSVIEATGRTGTRVQLLTIGELRCTGEALAPLTRATTTVTCIDADVANLSSAIVSAVRRVWGGL